MLVFMNYYLCQKKEEEERVVTYFVPFLCIEINCQIILKGLLIKSKGNLGDHPWL